MKKIKSFTVSPKYFSHVGFFPEINRCYTRSIEEARKAGFGPKDVETFGRRVDAIKRSIIKNGWMPMSVFILGRINGRIGLIDGQGRSAAINELKADGKFPENCQICVDMWDFDSIEEARNAIENINKGRRNWTAGDLFENQMKALGEKGVSIISEINNIASDLFLLEGTARFILYGYDAVRLTTFKEDIYSKKDPWSEYTINFLYELVSKLTELKWEKNEIKKVVTFSACEAYRQMIARIIECYGTDIYEPFKKRAVEVISSFSKNDIIRAFVGRKRDAIRVNLAEKIAYKLTAKNKIKEAMGMFA